MKMMLLGILLIIAIVSAITVTLTKHFTKQLKSVRRVYLGKLSDNQDDDIVETMEYLELTNGIKEVKGLS